jgi:hypothetical protein
VLNELEGVGDSFIFDLGLRGPSSNVDTHGSQGSRLLVRQAFVGLLDAVRVVVDGLVRFLVQIRKVGAGRFCVLLRLVSLQKFGFDDIPVVDINAFFDEAFKPTHGFIPETHFELQQFTGVIPTGDGAGVVNSDDEQTSGNGVSSWLAIVQRDIRRPFCAVVIIEGLSELWSSEEGLGGTTFMAKRR